MVTVCFKYAAAEPLELDIDGEAIMEMCSDAIHKPVGSVIVIRAGKVVPLQGLVESNEVSSQRNLRKILNNLCRPAAKRLFLQFH